ncbi:MAG: electron transfer flavoprotein subunit alpha [Deltaproteobacteria bacterium]|nr:electron transfer flavoprotein subunit alpha [Deltaproteobacteria bacterium]
MPILFINQKKCTLCGECIELCPFGALEVVNGVLEINAACKTCKICLKNCPVGAISLLDNARVKINKRLWKGVLVYVEHDESGINPVTLELIGEGRKLAGKIDHPVYALVMGDEGCGRYSKTLIEHGVEKVFVYRHKALKYFLADAYTNVFEDCINKVKPSVVLVGATPLGRSLAPRVAVRFRTGLTADCTELQIKKNTNMVQIRPAFGGNLMAQIVTPNSRPQFATVRPKVMDIAKPVDHSLGAEVFCDVTPEMVTSGIKVLSTAVTEKQVGIEQSEIIVVGGRALKAKKDLAMIHQLADLLGGEAAWTRPLIENGWGHYKRQVGQSGRTVKPKLMITVGVSGAIQFIAGMKTSECIIAINNDKKAPIFNIASYCIIGDLYEIVPSLIDRIRQGGKGL